LLSSTEPFVGIEEAAAFLGVTKRWLYNKQVALRIPRAKIAGRCRYRLSELSAWADAQRIA
jgi:predicted DNA-binding transcriptional regulator AlpA